LISQLGINSGESQRYRPNDSVFWQKEGCELQ